MVQTVTPQQTTLDRMTRLKLLVRSEGLDPEAAAREVGVDPAIAQLWLRLPDDLWPSEPTSNNSVATGSTAILPAPTNGLRCVLTCRVPAPAYDRLRAGESPLLEAAAQALETGLTLPRPEAKGGFFRFQRKPLAVTVTAKSLEDAKTFAKEAFDNDLHEATGWLIAHGLGMVFPLPTESEIADNQKKHQQTAIQQTTPPPPPATSTLYVPRHRPETRQPPPPDDSAPTGKELARRRNDLRINGREVSQRDLAAATGLSRGLIASIELGHRRHVPTRLRIAETLASLERDKRDKKEKYR